MVGMSAPEYGVVRWLGYLFDPTKVLVGVELVGDI